MVTCEGDLGIGVGGICELVRMFPVQHTDLIVVTLVAANGDPNKPADSRTHSPSSNNGVAYWL